MIEFGATAELCFNLLERPTPANAASAGRVLGTLHILRAGVFPANPQDVTITAADLRSIATAYDPARYMAPVVLGHPANDAPAWGWVRSLKEDIAGLWARVELSAELVSLIEAGRYRHVSVALWPPGSPGNPEPGSWSLRHVGFLGAQAPAVKGLSPFTRDKAPQPSAELAERTDFKCPPGYAVTADGAARYRSAVAYMAEHPGADFVTAVMAGERSAFNCPPGYAVSPRGAAVYRAAVAHMAENPGADFVTAVKAVEWSFDP